MKKIFVLFLVTLFVNTTVHGTIERNFWELKLGVSSKNDVIKYLKSNNISFNDKGDEVNVFMQLKHLGVTWTFTTFYIIDGKFNGINFLLEDLNDGLFKLRRALLKEIISDYYLYYWQDVSEYDKLMIYKDKKTIFVYTCDPDKRILSLSYYDINKWYKKNAEKFDGKKLYSFTDEIQKEILSLKNESEQLELLKDAAYLWEKAAIKGHLPSCLEIGNLYYHGLVYQKNYVKAIQWLEKAKRMTKPEQNGNCYLLLGYCYFEGGNGINKDYKKAFDCFLEGTKYDNDKCRYSLLYMFIKEDYYVNTPVLLCKYADMLYSNNKEEYTNIYTAFYNKLAYYYAKRNEYINALSSIDKSISAADDASSIANYSDSKGEIYLMMGKEDEAIKMWRKVMELDKGNKDFYIKNSNLYKELKAKGKI